MRPWFAICLALIVIIPVLILAPSAVAANTVSDLGLAIPGLDTRTNDTGAIVMVAGIYHDLNLTFSEAAGSITIDLHKADIPTEDPTNRSWYRWTYDGVIGWDVQNKTSPFIRNGTLSADGLHADVRLGIDSGAYIGAWVLEVYADDVLVDSRDVTVEEPRVGLAHSSPNYLFRQEPLNQNVTILQGEQTFMVQNTGNILVTPIWEVESPAAFLLARLNLTALPESLDPGESVRSSVSYQTGYTTPGFYRWSIRMVFQPLNVISSGTVSLKSQIAVDISGTVIAARQNLQLTSDGDGTLVMQYPSAFSTAFEDPVTLVIYLNGRTEASFSIEAADFDLVRSEVDGISQEMPYTLLLEETVENRIFLRFQPTVDNTITAITLALRATDGSAEILAKIDVSIERKVPVIRTGSDDTNPLVVMGIIGAVLLLIGVLLGGLAWYERRRRAGP